MSAEGSQSGINIREEVVWGEIDTGQFTGMNFVSEDMAFKKEKKSSENVRPDRQTANLVDVDAATEGGIETQFQAVNIDPLLPGCLFAQDWVAPGTIAAPVDFTIETGSGVGGIITFDALDTIDIIVGQHIKIASSTAKAANVGTFLVKAVSGQNVTVNSPLVTEADIADVVLTGSRIVNGVYRHSYSIERALNDISQFFVYKGMVPNVFEMSIESGSPVMANISFVGKDEELAQTQWGSTDPTDLSTLPIINSGVSVGQIAIDGVAIGSCEIQKVSFSLDNKATGKKGVGVLGNCDVKGKAIEIKGAITLYFEDETYYQKYLASTSFGLSTIVSDSLGNTYGVNLPHCEFDEATANVTGKDDDVLVEGSFAAIMGAAEGFTIVMSRALI